MPSIEIADQASFVRLRGQALGIQQGGGIRGKVSRFSEASRKRLLDYLNSVARSATSAGIFVTLTYPDVFSAEPGRWKRDLDAFFKRFDRKFPGAAVVWRLELKERQRGTNVGNVAPHFHLLVFGVELIPCDWLSRSWYEVVGSGDEKHLRAGTRVERLRSRGGVIAYAAKYMSKTEQSEALEVGRLWGISGRDNLPVYIVKMILTWPQFYYLRRVLRGWRVRQYKKKRRIWHAGARGQGMTAYLDSDAAGRLLASCILG